jgi:hypothetical protein
MVYRQPVISIVLREERETRLLSGCRQSVRACGPERENRSFVQEKASTGRMNDGKRTPELTTNSHRSPESGEKAYVLLVSKARASG